MRRILAAAAVLALLLLAGCAGGQSSELSTAASGRPPGADEVRLIVSRDFGASITTDVTTPATADLTVMRLLAVNARVETQYGGGFVRAINGVASTYGSVVDGDAEDWFYWVDGIMADMGAGDFVLNGGETVWWDYHAWARAAFLPVAVAAFPAPWVGDDVPVTTNGETAELEQWAAAYGIKLGAGERLSRQSPAAGIVVATAAEASATPWLRDRIAGGDGGVELVKVRGGEIIVRALDGTTGPSATGACLALPNPEHGGRPLLLLLVREHGDLTTLLPTITPSAVSARLAVATVDGSLVPLPWAQE